MLYFDLISRKIGSMSLSAVYIMLDKHARGPKVLMSSLLNISQLFGHNIHGTATKDTKYKSHLIALGIHHP